MRLGTAGVLVLCLGATGAAQAGIDFDAMPEGCSWSTRYSDGSVVTDTYVGKKGRKHLTEVTDAKGQVIRRVTYDAKGRMTRKDWADGNWETFTPYSCFAEEGSCTYRYRNSSGGDQQIKSRTTASGEGFVVQAGPVGEARYNDEYIEIGAFGMMTVSRSRNYTTELIGMENCGTGS
jgi:YD repeat-containing protein